MLPGAFVGLGAGLCARRRSFPLAVTCAALSVALGLYSEWRLRPFTADPSFSYFFANHPQGDTDQPYPDRSRRVFRLPLGARERTPLSGGCVCFGASIPPPSPPPSPLPPAPLPLDLPVRAPKFSCIRAL
jgi:hypothetical protein